MTGTHSEVAEVLLDSLDEQQRAVAMALHGPVCVLAGAGTGKTRAITHRIAYGVATGAYVSEQVLALTFTSRAAAEMRSRLRDLGVSGVQTRTFHSAALRQLQYFWPQAIGGALPQLIDHKAALISEAARRVGVKVDRPGVRDLAAEVEWAKVSMHTPENYVAKAAGRSMPAGLETRTVSRIFQAYEDLKSDRQLIDFEDVLLITAGILADDPKIAATVRAQYRHFVVDEYQDVSPLQHRLLDLWLGERDELCVVGDSSQTIYSFTGATSRYLVNFDQRFPRAELIRLVRDYRSTPQVVSLANTLLAARTPSDAAANQAWAPPLTLRAQRPDGPPAEFIECADDEVEAETVARRIATLLKEGYRAAEIAVLFRTNGQSEALEQALSVAGIGYQLRGGERFYQRKEVRDAILSLRAAAHSAGADASQSLAQHVADVLASIGYSTEAPATSGAQRERWESLSAIVSLATELASKRGMRTLPDFVAELSERAAAQHAPTVEGVSLASLHSAKGLEWDAVFLVGLSEGLLPISFAESGSDYDEERRLLYVGITRARLFLHFSWSLSRNPGGRAFRKASRYIDDIRHGASSRTRSDALPPRKQSRAQRPRSKPQLCRVCARPLETAAERKIGRCEECPATFDEQTFDDLKAWRLQTAKAQQVPAFMIFTDATLVAIAELQPDGPEDLLTVAGVGQSKLEKYGDEVLEVLSSHSTHSSKGES